MTGFPMPERYDQHYINKYAFPKGLVAVPKPSDWHKKKGCKLSIYDVQTNQNRKGVSGWKLTKNKPDPSLYHMRA